ncbi:hypothetical protein MATL_G00186120 [Megalops atlanticus]|uniref:asparaginase n=1 Tax=Megalops atlanticus TaxID=7932 RepID=A0A9D3PQ77_MEGAT|nr:hypothetical protein MATL_G00186120 [Megalops atlanticus]
MMKRVFIFYTGGTIGMVLGPDGKLIPGKRGDFTDEIRRHPELYKAEKDGWFVLPEKATDDCPGNFQVVYRIEEVLKPIDSSKMLPQNWSDIANKILTEDETKEYDGFIILHGTDTMAYTSSALSFLLHGKIRKPVVLTGAQRTLFEPRSDAVDNMLGSLLIAGCYADYAPLQQVSLFFDNKLFQGNRVTKFDSNSFEAFTSPKFKPLVEMGVDITVNCQCVPVTQCENFLDCFTPFLPLSNTSSDVRLIFLYPGIQEDFVRSALRGAGGVVLASFGAGNVPDFDWLKSAMIEAKEREVLFLNCCQVFRGVVEAIYDVSSWLVQAGVVSGHDITIESALTKMIWVLQIAGISYTLRKEILEKSVCGEMTVPEERDEGSLE